MITKTYKVNDRTTTIKKKFFVTYNNPKKYNKLKCKLIKNMENRKKIELNRMEI